VLSRTTLVQRNCFLIFFFSGWENNVSSGNNFWNFLMILEVYCNGRWCGAPMPYKDQSLLVRYRESSTWKFSAIGPFSCREWSHPSTDFSQPQPIFDDWSLRVEGQKGLVIQPNLKQFNGQSTFRVACKKMKRKYNEHQDNLHKFTFLSHCWSFRPLRHYPETHSICFLIRTFSCYFFQGMQH
jgi:hypothetical protein